MFVLTCVQNDIIIIIVNKKNFNSNRYIYKYVAK